MITILLKDSIVLLPFARFYINNISLNIFCCDADKQDMYGCTALMYSCMDCHNDDVTRLLTKKGNSNPNIQDNFLNTALMHAVVASNAAALQILVTSSALDVEDIELLVDIGIERE
jgi:ankyrin repeat protein